MWQYIPGIAVAVAATIALVWTLAWCRRKRRAFNKDIATLKDIWETKVRPIIERKPSELDKAVSSLAQSANGCKVWGASVAREQLWDQYGEKVWGNVGTPKNRKD